MYNDFISTLGTVSTVESGSIQNLTKGCDKKNTFAKMIAHKFHEFYMQT